MSKDNIIEMARQAKLPNSDLYRGNLEAFAKLVAAKEREAVVDIAQSYCGRLVHEEEFQKEIRARGEA